MIPISLLIFDLDGTLVNTLEDITSSVNHALARVGRSPISKESVKRFVGDGAEALLSRSLGESTERLTEAVVLYKKHYRSNLLVTSSLYPSVRETLEYFKSLPMAVISNKTMESVAPLLERLDLARYFKIALGADYGLPLKPAPDSIEKILLDIGAPKDRTVIVGDSTADILAGKAAGIITCCVTYGYRPEAELRELSPDFIIEEFADLRKIFKAADSF